MTPANQLRKLLADSGLQIDTRNIGDGVTRYRFFAPDQHPDYFASEGLYTAIGRREAITFLRGYRAAQTQNGGQP